MPKYEVLQDSVIGSGIVKAGTIIEYDGKSEGEPGDNLRLIKEPKKRPVPTEEPGDPVGVDRIAGQFEV